MRHRELQALWARRVRGGSSSDDLDGVIQRLEQKISALILELGRAAEEGDPDRAPPTQRRPVVLDAVRLERAGVALAAALAWASSADGPPQEGPDSIRALSATLCMKAGRISCHLAAPRSVAAWDADAVPNLLLVERTKAALKRRLAPEPEGCGESSLPALRALAELDRILDPLISTLDLRVRDLLDRLIEAGRAPSPFCVTGE